VSPPTATSDGHDPHSAQSAIATDPLAPTPSTEGSVRARRRLLVVSHPAIVSVNQEVYRELLQRGWEVTIVVPSRWRHDYSAADIRPQALAGLESTLHPVPVALAGRQQRHFYLTNCRSLCLRTAPDVAFLEAEPFAVPAAQWGHSLHRLGIPFGVHCYENIDRDLPLPVRWMRTRVLRDAAFVAARSDTAAKLVRSWGARGDVELAPPAVPPWADAPSAALGTPRNFTVGYAGRLTESKGLIDLLAAVRQLDAPVELILIGDGALRGTLDGQSIPGSKVRVLDGLRHEEMGSGYAQLDVLVLPSHTTATWKEQFGRVIIEALWCNVPVVGSDSGEIPWLLGLTGGGLIFPEGQPERLAEQLTKLRREPDLRRQLASNGRTAVERLFTVAAATDPLERMLVRAAEARHARS
jgi:glycosyltransferase involved in cell wall biosynthesis